MSVSCLQNRSTINTICFGVHGAVFVNKAIKPLTQLLYESETTSQQAVLQKRVKGWTQSVLSWKLCAITALQIRSKACCYIRSCIWWCCRDLNGRCFSLSFFRITKRWNCEIEFKAPYGDTIVLKYVVDHLAVLFGDLKCLCKEIQSIFENV